ncbi:MAG: DUF2474 domain-containing protein [Parvularculaceae bacterium]
MAGDGSPDKTGWREIAWFAGLWAAGVAAVSALAFVIRLFIG